MRYLILSLFWSVSVLATSSSPALPSNDCTSGWLNADWKNVPFPDTNAQYLSYQFKIPKGKQLALKFSGVFPQARYASYTVYDQKDENAVSTVYDVGFVSDDGVNPYQPGVNRFGSHTYTVNAFPGSSGEDGSMALPFDPNKDVKLDIWFRVYVPEGRVVPPRIQAFDAQTKQPTSCPPLARHPYSIATVPGQMGREPAPFVRAKVPSPSSDLHFFKPDSTSLDDNPQNRYMSVEGNAQPQMGGRIAGRVERQVLADRGAWVAGVGNVMIVKFKVPTFPDTEKGLPSFSGMEEVRYWSFCIAGANTKTYACLKDAEVNPVMGKDGQKYAVVVVGPDSVQAEASKKGFGFILSSGIQVPLLFYRQMLARPDFAGNIDKVVPLPQSQARGAGLDRRKYYGDSSIGAYSPTGKACTLEQLKKNNCGVM